MPFLYIRQLIEHRFVRSVLFLQIGSMIGTFVQAAAGIFIARILQPELFGIYSLVFGVAGVISFLLGTGAQDAMSTILAAAHAQRNAQEIEKAFGFLVKIAIVFGCIALFTAIASPIVTQWLYGSALIGMYAVPIVAGSALSTVFFLATLLGLQITGAIRTMTGLMALDQILRFSLSLFFVWLGYGVVGAVAGQFIGAVLLFAVSIWMWQRLSKHDSLFPSLSKVIHEVRQGSIRTYLRFTAWVMFDRNVSALFMSLPVLVVGAYVSVTEVGYFKLAFGYVNLALSLLGPVSTMLNVEFPKKKLSETHQLRGAFLKATKFGVFVSLALTTAAISVSPLAFRVLYGENYLPSIPYIFGLYMYGALFGVGVALGPMWRALDKVRTSIFINVLTLGIGIPAGIILIKEFHLWGAVAMVTILYTVSHAVSFLYLARNLKSLESEGYPV